jgi:hypothetical protein
MLAKAAIHAILIFVEAEFVLNKLVLLHLCRERKFLLLTDNQDYGKLWQVLLNLRSVKYLYNFADLKMLAFKRGECREH